MSTGRSNCIIQPVLLEWEDMLPPWAIRKATPGIYEVGASLPTRDGRRMGNAHIIVITSDEKGIARPYYTIITDAGQKLVMSSTELNDQFWPPRWISDVKEVILKFHRATVEE